MIVLLNFLEHNVYRKLSASLMLQKIFCETKVYRKFCQLNIQRNSNSQGIELAENLPFLYYVTRGLWSIFSARSRMVKYFLRTRFAGSGSLCTSGPCRPLVGLLDPREGAMAAHMCVRIVSVHWTMLTKTLSLLTSLVT